MQNTSFHNKKKREKVKEQVGNKRINCNLEERSK